MEEGWKMKQKKQNPREYMKQEQSDCLGPKTPNRVEGQDGK